MKNLGLIPLTNFGIVIPKLYRSAQPLFGYQYNWVKEVLGVDTIVNLRSEKNVDQKFCDKLGINSVTFAVKDHFPPTEQMAIDFIEFVKNHKGKMLIHCEHGHGRTSTFSVLSKVAHGFDIEKAIEDERERFHYQFKHKSQEDFLRNLLLENLVESI